MGVSVKHIETEIRGRNKNPVMPVPQGYFNEPVDEVGSSAVIQGEVGKGVRVWVECLKSCRGAHPGDSTAVFDDFKDQVAPDGVRLLLVVMETDEIKTVETVQPVVRRNPEHAVATLEKVVYLRAGQSAARVV